MASITIRNLENDLKARLRVRAARHGHSMEEEARVILRRALAEPGADSLSLAQMIRRRIEPLGGLDLPRADREPLREPPTFKR